jgi:SAM-dependent methyltransferase
LNTDERQPDWYNHDPLWENTTNYMFGSEIWERAPQEVEQVLALAQLTPPLRVLDLPCGVGRHSLELARLGCEVTGVDRTAHYLAQAREKFNAAGLNAQFIESDMRTFQQPAAFDLAINLYTSFGYFEDVNDDLRVLANFYASLRPGGVLVMDLMGKEVLARIYTPRDWQTLADGTIVLNERSVHHDWSWIEVRWIIIKDSQSSCP